MTSSGANNLLEANPLKDALLKLRPWLVHAFVYGLVGSLLILIPTAYMFEVYERVVNSRNTNTLLMLTIFTLFGLMIMEALEWSRSDAMREAGERFEKALMPRIYGAVFKMNLSKPGSASTLPIQDIRTIKDFLPGPALAALPEIPAALVFLVLIFLLSPVLGVVAMVGAILQVGLAWANERKTHDALKQANKFAIIGQQQTDAMLRHAEVVKAMGMRPALHQRWMVLQSQMLVQQAMASDGAGLFQSMTKVMQTTLSSALLGFAAWLVLDNALWGGPGMLIVGSVLGGRILAPLAQVIAQWRSVVNVQEAWKRLNQILQQTPAVSKAMPLPAPRGFLVVESLVAGAPGVPGQILRGIQFSLEPGQVLAVVGPSASGKSTLARLLVGVWPTLAGKVRLDGSDVFVWNKQELGPHVGYLPQDVELLDGTIGENIARFGRANQTALETVAKLVGLHTWIMTLPDQYETQLGTEGARLSGGQRQRVGLARALYGNPAYVVLDEPNSSLDEAGEAALIHAVNQLRETGTTFVLITHRTSALKACTHMLVLREGAQQMFGPRDDVLAALNKAATGASEKGAQNAR